jgi:GT2 family glycosyltransferase
MTADLPSATIVIPNYNGVHHLDDCLASLRALRYDGSHCEVLLVDNASTDGSAEWTRTHYPEVRVVEAGENLGFAGACNLGARESTCAIVAFLNNDMRVDEAWLTELTNPFDGQRDVVATGGKILSWNGKAIDFVGGQVNFYGHGFQPLHGRPADDAAELTTRPALFACGGSMAARRELFLRSGGFDEDYFAFF